LQESDATSDPNDREADSLRIFIAVQFPPQIMAGVTNVQERLQKGCRFVGANPSWVPTDTFHQTLVFLGEQSRDCLDDVSLAMQRAVDRVSIGPIRLAVTGVEFFPSARDPRTVAMALKGEVGKLSQLQSALREELRLAGFHIESRPFLPHVTLARIKSPKGFSGLKGIVDGHRSVSAGKFEVDRIELLESVPSGSRRTYRTLNAVMLPSTPPQAEDQ
jgi:2'-5' RNA ligase